jgi:cell division protein FtsN
MEDRGLRDVERWRDKIEVRLDNRQVFFLFFGSALVACMLFVLGVIVGKRLEARGRAVSPEIDDPLALLDKVAGSPRPAQGGVTFPQALFGTNGKTATADKAGKKTASVAPAAVESAGETAKPAPAPAAKAPAEAKPEAKPAPAKAEAKPAPAVAETKKPEPAQPQAKPAEVKPAETKPAETKPAEPKVAETKPAEAKLAETKPAKAKETKPAETKPAPEKETKPLPIPTIAAGGESKSKGRFALQLSSFQDKAEAEAFAQKFSGERPYMVMSDIPGKGIWYRVRVGDYASAKDAVAAKEAFEKKHNVIAYVAQK